MKIGVVGHGTVGRALVRFFGRYAGNEIAIYDKYVDPFASKACAEAVDASDIVFVAVPTPYDAHAGACDLSSVRAVVRRFSAPLCIKSTVPPGTTDALISETGKRIGCSPEYLGESRGHPWQEVDDCGFVVLAGDPTVRALVREAYASSASTSLRYVEADTRAAELAKYMENCFLATKVAFVNQFAELARDRGIDFAETRSVFLLDQRIGESHTRVEKERGFAGKCLPKDLKSLVAWSGGPENAPLLQAVLDYNADVQRRDTVPRTQLSVANI